MRFLPGSIAQTFFGWTPRLRRTLSGHSCPCGCVIGAYEAASGEVVEILDVRHQSCSDENHRMNTVLSIARSKERLYPMAMPPRDSGHQVVE